MSSTLDAGPLAGFVAPGWEPVRDAFVANFTDRDEVGASVCVYRDGAPVVELCGGRVDVFEVEGGGAESAVGVGLELLGVAAEGEDVAGWGAAVEEGVDGEGAELAGGADDGDGHEGLSPSAVG